MAKEFDISGDQTSSHHSLQWDKKRELIYYSEKVSKNFDGQIKFN